MNRRFKNFVNVVELNSYTYDISSTTYFSPKKLSGSILNYTRKNNIPKYSSNLIRGVSGLFTKDYKSINYIHLNRLNAVSLFLSNPFFIKSSDISSNNFLYTKKLHDKINYYLKNLYNKYSLVGKSYHNYELSNIIPTKSFSFVLDKKVFNSYVNHKFRSLVTPWYYHTVVRFVENTSGRRALLQVYPFMSQEVKKDYVVRYKLWLPRMAYYERKLGGRFFLEEAIHIIHLSFLLKDPIIIATWFKAMILRISFWRTRSIFRFMKYLLNNYFIHVFSDLGFKGFKVVLKGKISVGGNSRKRSIRYRVGETSYSKVGLKVLNHFQTINTFTGVMGFNL
jgi:hypothetical protein